MTINKRVGNVCRVFRKQVLHLTLEEFCDDISIKTISSFENGKSTNINHLDLYFNKCTDDFQKDILITLIITNIRGGKNGKKQ